jgi:hypothetical protein
METTEFVILDEAKNLFLPSAETLHFLPTADRRSG